MCGEVWQIWTSGYRDSLDPAIWEYHPGETFLDRGAWGNWGGREGAAKRKGAIWPGRRQMATHTCALAVRTRGASRIVTNSGMVSWSFQPWPQQLTPTRLLPACPNFSVYQWTFFSFSFKSTWVNRRLNETNSKAELTTHVLLPFRVSEWVSSSVHRNRTHPLQRTTSIDFLLLSLSLHYSTVNRRTRSSKVRRERSQVSSIRLSARRVGD